MDHPAFEKLSLLLNKLPNVGKKSAQKLALNLMLQKDDLLPLLQEQLILLKDTIKTCHLCGNLSESDPCSICANPTRSKKTLCLVKDLADLYALEKTNLFEGKYFILSGLLSARTQITPETLGLDRLKNRITTEKIEELLFALPMTLEGKTTAHYIQNECPNLTYTELAHGIPIGGDLEYLDEGTIAEAFRSRKSI
ncbi:MAG: recombination protein RecR [Alphaproteobacteria bacterium]|nr:recombination protein RecR [Alphaproteobacteria bacterium]